MKSTIIMIIGVAIFAAGLLFVLQGADIVHWPAQSSMIGHRDWIEKGVVVVMIGGALMLTARRIRKI